MQNGCGSEQINATENSFLMNNSMNLMARRIPLLDLVKPGRLLLLLFGIMMGCSTSGRFRSTKDESYEDKLERVLIVYSDEDTRAILGRDFSHRLVGDLIDLFARQNVTSESVQFERSRLDGSATVKAAETRFQPRQVLYFRVVRMNSSSSVEMLNPDHLPHFSNSMVVTFEFEILDSKGDKAIWRTDVDYYSVPDPKKVAADLGQNMRAAKLL
jgi:hypothetical protein